MCVCVCVCVRRGLSPEIVHFRLPTDYFEEGVAPEDWYIKGARCVCPLDVCIFRGRC